MASYENTGPESDFWKDPFGGVGQLIVDRPHHRCWVAEVDGKIQQCVVERVDPLLDINAERRAVNAGKKWGDGDLVAAIPASLFWHGDFAKAHADDDQEWMKRFLNDSDNAKLRTREGKL